MELCNKCVFFQFFSQEFSRPADGGKANAFASRNQPGTHKAQADVEEKLPTNKRTLTFVQALVSGIPSVLVMLAIA